MIDAGARRWIKVNLARARATVASAERALARGWSAETQAYLEAARRDLAYWQARDTSPNRDT